MTDRRTGRTDGRKLFPTAFSAGDERETYEVYIIAWLILVIGIKQNVSVIKHLKWVVNRMKN
jgi:hypothetical protein